MLKPANCYLPLATLLLALLSACASPTQAPFLPAPTYGPVANAILADAGATAAAATGVAYLSTGQAANAIAAQATADYRATADHLELVQTQRAMDDQAASVTGTAQAHVAQATQSAQETATAQSNQQAIISVTIAYVGTQLAYDSDVADARAQSEIMAARADAQLSESVNDAMSGLAWGIVIFVSVATIAILSGLVYFSWLYFQRKQQIDTEEYQSRSDARIDEARAKSAEAWANTIRASLIEINGQQHMLTRRGLAPMLPAPVIDPDQKAEADWRQACRMLVYNAVELHRNGENNPFSEPCLTGRNVIVFRRETRRPWLEGARAIIDLLKDMGILAPVKQGGKTWWAVGWGMERFETDFSMHPLPYLPSIEVPGVRITLRSSEVGELPRSSEVEKLVVVPDFQPVP